MSAGQTPLQRLLEELRERRVTRVAITYIAVAFAGLQGADVVLTPLGGGGAYRWLVLAVLAGFPVALVVSWFFDVRAARPANAPAPDAAASVQRRRFSRGRVGVIVLLALAGVGFYGYRRVAWHAGVAADAEVMAIAPFTAVGGGATELGEGLAQLLSANLDQVGGLRTVDPAKVLRAWRGGGAEARSEDEALEVGRRLGAGSVLTGTAVAAGPRLRLTSVLRAVNGREIARSQVTGPANDVLLLADSLSNRLLRAIWRARTPIPQLRIAAITTSNLDAIRAYLDGERHYRNLRWDSAVAALQRAVELDSTFALAQRRLATVYGWSGDFGSPLRKQAAIAAARFPERLPERERTLAVADALFEGADDYSGALDSVDSQLRRYPDDAEALNLRAEVLLHGTEAGVMGETDSTLLAAFEAVLRADPDLVPAMIHPLSLTAQMGDSLKFRQYAARLLGSRLPGDARTPALVDSLVGLFWARDPAAGGFLQRLMTMNGLQEIRWTLTPLAVLIRAERDPNPMADALLKIPPEQLDTLSLTFTAGCLLGVGRLSDAERLLQQLAPAAPQMALSLHFAAAGFGLAPADFAPRLWPNAQLPLPPGTQPDWLAAGQAIMYLTDGDTAAAARALRVAAAAGPLPPPMEQLRRFQAARLQLLRGDAPGGIRQMEAALHDMETTPQTEGVPPPFFHRVFLAVAQAGYPPTRPQGIAALQRLSRTAPPIVPLVRIYLARALEADGRSAEAEREYAVFALQTGRAEGRVRLLHGEAVKALDRLRASRR